MERYGIFVDAGYLLAGGGQAINAGHVPPRHELRLDCGRVIEALREKGRGLSDTEKLLRIYWYDGAFVSGLTQEQCALGSSDDVKLRLGLFNGLEQKGVDSRIVTDLAELSRKRAICDAVLVSGDDDLRIGVEIAQGYGVRVHLLSVAGVSPAALLRREADTTSEFSVEEVRGFLKIAAPQQQPPLDPDQAPPAEGDAIDYAANVGSYLETLGEASRGALIEAVRFSGAVPKEHDGRLLARTRTQIGRELDPGERVNLRDELKRQLGV